MQLTPREFDKLLIYMMADVALKRKAKGLKLNYPEAVAIISAAALDGARAGKTIEEAAQDARSVADQGRRDGRCRRSDSDGADRGRVHRRQPARDRAHADPVASTGGRHGRSESGSYGRRECRSRDSRRGGRRLRVQSRVRSVSTPIDLKVTTLKVRNTGRPSGPGGLALPFFRGQSRAGVRPRRGVRAAPQHPGRDRAPLRAWRRARGQAGPLSAASAACTASTIWSTAPPPARMRRPKSKGGGAGDAARISLVQ